MQPDFNEILRQLAALKESRTTMEAIVARSRAEGDSAIARLQASFERLRTDTMRAIGVASGLIIAAVGVAAAGLGVVLSDSDDPPIIIYATPPAAVVAGQGVAVEQQGAVVVPGRAAGN